MSTSSTSTPDALPTSGSAPNGPPQGSTNLYLFTFLATLCLLLLVSSSVTFRAILLRRRIQRQIEDASNNPGLPPADRARRTRPAEKPKFHDAWVAPGGESWETIMPVSAQFVSSKRLRRELSDLPSSALDRLSAALSRRWRTPLGPPDSAQIDTLPIPPSETTQEGPQDEKKPPKQLQVSVLVAMPSPRSVTPMDDGPSTSQPPEDDGIIHNVVIGVTQIPYS